MHTFFAFQCVGRANMDKIAHLHALLDVRTTAVTTLLVTAFLVKMVGGVTNVTKPAAQIV